MKIFLGFDFYGAGNIGDDLMMAGFLDVLKHYLPAKLACITPHNIASQVNRFPDVEWLPAGHVNRLDVMTNTDCWVGVGGTPFQMTGGPWLLNRILNDLRIIKEYGKSIYMLGVGAEREVLVNADIVKTVLERIDYIWTRDRFTKDLLVKRLGFDSEKIHTGGDLANISLQNIFSDNNSISKRHYDLALTYYSESHIKKERNNLRKFIENISVNKSVIFVANETRKNSSFEHGIYRAMFGGLRSLFKKAPIKYYAPNYDNCELEELVKHFLDYKVVMASRYHALLAGAWAGCRLVALSRSSKIEALATELDIPIVEQPFNLGALYNGYKDAKYVSRDKLNEMAERASNSILDFCNRVKHC